MARHFAWTFAAVFALAALGSAGAAAASVRDEQRSDAPKKVEPSEPQRGDGRRPDNSDQDGPPRWKWWLHPDTRRELKLTDQQSKKINEVWESTAPQLREKWHELEQLEESLAKTLKEYTAQVPAVTQQVEKIEKLRADNNATRTVMIYRMHLLLTPEQRVKVDEMRKRMDEERKRQNQDKDNKR
jgi:Spy/CpxP family protein refolding chaperone